MRNSDIIKQVALSTGMMDSGRFQHWTRGLRTERSYMSCQLSLNVPGDSAHETSGGVKPGPAFQLHPTLCSPMQGSVPVLLSFILISSYLH